MTADAFYRATLGLAADRVPDAIWTAACLLHVPRDCLPAMRGRIRTALRRGGLHVASYEPIGVEGRDRFGRLLNQPTCDLLLAAYAAAGAWDIEDHAGSGQDGEQVPWVAITMRRVG